MQGQVRDTLALTAAAAGTMGATTSRKELTESASLSPRPRELVECTLDTEPRCRSPGTTTSPTPGKERPLMLTDAATDERLRRAVRTPLAALSVSSLRREPVPEEESAPPPAAPAMGAAIMASMPGFGNRGAWYGSNQPALTSWTSATRTLTQDRQRDGATCHVSPIRQGAPIQKEADQLEQGGGDNRGP